MDIREHLEEIRKRRGQLTPEVVLDEARDPAHPLHSRFEWDDTVAAERYRRAQAGGLIRMARIVYKDATEVDPAKTVRAYHSIERDGQRSYEPADEIAGDAVAAEMLLREMQRDIKALSRRYGGFEDYWKIIQAEMANKHMHKGEGS